MLKLMRHLRIRLARRFSVSSLGPNEARLFYDAAASAGAAIFAFAFSVTFIPPTGALSVHDLLFLLLPLMLIGFNAAFGIYSGLKKASGRAKAIALLCSVIASVLGTSLLTASLAPCLLWGAMVYPALVLPRLLLGLPYSRHKRFAAVAVNVRGPVLVLGGAGYIGSHTVDLLLKAGRSVRVLDKLMYGSESLAPFKNHRQFEFIEGDATDIAKLTLAMKDVSAVIHLAGLVGDPACAVDADFTRHTNIVATRMAKDVAQSLGVHRFVFASSCSVYGVTDKEVRETDVLNPVSLYAQTKIDSERELLYSSADDFFVTVLRFATVFGHSRRSRFDLVANLFTAQAMTDGLITVIGPNQWRPFIHVRDLARAIVMVLGANPADVQSQIFNVGDKRMNMTIMQLANTVKDVVEKYRKTDISVLDNPEDRRNYSVSFSKIRSTLGFEAETLMRAGIEEMADHFHNGNYTHYRDELYHNASMTTAALRRFQDPSEMVHLYGPLNRSIDAR